MNVCPGGAHPKMGDTVWAGHVQRMADGTPKGLKMVLEERDINTVNMDMKGFGVRRSHTLSSTQIIHWPAYTI